jgi:hypothetical protein
MRLLVVYALDLHILIMSKLVTKKHSYADILKGSMAQTQNIILWVLTLFIAHRHR